MDIIKCLKSFLRINERAKRIVAIILCVSLVMVDTLPYYAENLFDDVSNDAVTDFADTLLSTPSSAEEENEIVDEDIDEVGGTLFGAEFNCIDIILTYNETRLGQYVSPNYHNIQRGTSFTFPIIDESRLYKRNNHFAGWRWSDPSKSPFFTSTWSDVVISNGGTLTATQTEYLYSYFVSKGKTSTSDIREAKFEATYVPYGHYEEADLQILTPTIDDWYGIDINEIPDEAKVDGKYAIYFYYDKDILGQDIPSNPIVATYNTEINFPSIDTSLVAEGCTFEGWMRDDIIIGSGGTLTAEQSKICTGVGTDKYVIFEAKINVPELHTVHFDIDEEYYADVIPPITNATLSVIKFPSLPNQLRGVEIASWKSSDGGYIFNPGASVSFSSLDWTKTNDHYFIPILEVKDINVHFKNELPPDIPGTIPASRSDVIVKVNQPNPNEHQQYTIEGYKHEGWGLSSDGEIAIGVDENNIEPLRFLKAGQLSYDMYPIFLPNEEKPEPEPAPEEPKKRRYFGSGGGSGGGTYYSDGASSGIFEFDPLLNKFKCYIFDKNNNKQYVVNDWFKIVDKKDGKAYWYLTDATGCMVTGWTLCDGVFYYFSESVSDYGMMANGTYNINGKEYVFTSDGKYVGDANLIPKVYNIVNRNIVANMSDTEMSAFNDTEIFAFNGTESTNHIYIEYYDINDNFIASASNIYYNNYKQRYEFFMDQSAPEVTGKNFVGWEVIDSEDPFPRVYTSDMKVGTKKSWQFKPKYSVIGYHINYYNREYGTVYNSDIVDVSTTSDLTNYTIVEEVPTKVGYNFKGFTDEIPATSVKYNKGETIAICQDLNLYPIWEKNTNTEYISDIQIGYDKNSGEEARKNAKKGGYTLIDCDLNKGAGGYFMYLGVKKTTDPSEAIRGLVAYDSSFFRDRYQFGGSTMVLGGYNYKTVPKYDNHNDYIDLNKGAGGSYVYLYYTKDAGAGNPITTIAVSDFSDAKTKEFFSNGGWRTADNCDIGGVINHESVVDFNSGCTRNDKKHPKYIYIQYKCEDDVIMPNPNMDIRYVNATNWMAKIPGNRLITHINTPGAHDAGTSFVKVSLPSGVGAECQYADTPIYKQLNLGVRYLDCRLGYNGSLNFYHGNNNDGGIRGWFMENICYEYILGNKFKILTFETVLNWCIDFVAAHPTEAIFMRLRHETREIDDYSKEGNRILGKYKNTNRLYMPSDKKNRIPTMDEVRGKVVIINGYGAGSRQLDYGFEYNIPSENEEDNDGDYGEKKIEHVKSFYAKHGNVAIDKLDKNTFYMVHTSCWDDRNKLPNALKQAKIVNPWFLKNFPLEKGRYYGWIPMDFVTQELAEKVYSSNFK